MLRVKCSLTTKVLCILIFVTNITQMPQLIQMGANSWITLICWGSATLYLLGNCNICLNRLNFRALVYGLLFLLLSLFLQIITGKNYLSTSLSYPFLLSVFVFVIGSLYVKKIQLISVSSLYMSYISSGLIVSVAVYYDSFASGYDWMARGYAYASKNSVAQIILTVLILLIFTEISRKIPLIIRVIVAIGLIVLLAMLKSRASLIGIIIIIIFLLSSKQTKLKFKIFLILFIVIFIRCVYVNEELYDIVVNGVILAGRNSQNLNDISSGRFEMIGEFVRIFSIHPIWGNGAYYLESFPLSVLAQYGIVGSIPIILFMCLPFILLKRISNQEVRKVLTVLIVCYYINGLFEELAPLGPGVKCYFLWFLLGLQSNDNSELK